MRVTIHEETEGNVVTLKIEGKLVGRHVPELKRAWDDLASSLGGRKLIVDLRDVQHVDASGRTLLANIHAAQKATFLADTPLTRYFAEQAQKEGATSVENID